MSRDVSPELKAHLAGELTTLATCWKVTRTDDEVFAFTDCDRDLTVDGVTYLASSAMLASAVKQDRSSGPDNLEATAFLDSEMITESDLMGGLYDDATVDVFQVNREDLSMGVLWKAKGWTLGEVTIKDSSFSAEIMSKISRLSQTGIEVYSKTCRAVLYDERCGLSADDSAFGVDGEVTGVVTIVDPLAGNRTSRQKFYDTSRTETDATLFIGSRLTWDGTGLGYNLNNGITSIVRTWDPTTGLFELEEELPNEITVGDGYTLRWACTKTWEVCLNRFDNIENFRGEPFVPVGSSLPLNSDKTWKDPDPWTRGR